MKTSILEANILQALEESQARRERQEAATDLCDRDGHFMQYSLVYGCFRCLTCGKRSSSEDGNEKHPFFDRD